MDPFEPLNVDAACARIRDDILRGRLLPGAKLVAQKLAEQLGTSRTPIKEALARLETEALVVRAERWGYSVRTISHRDAEEMFEARLVIEVGNARFAAQRASAADIDAMREAQDVSLRELRAGNLMEFQQHARRVHECISEAAGNSLLQRMFQQVNHLVIVFGTSLLRAEPARATEIASENDAIVAAVAAHDPERAAALMQQHIARGHASFRDTLTRARPPLRLL